MHVRANAHDLHGCQSGRLPGEGRAWKMILDGAFVVAGTPASAAHGLGNAVVANDVNARQSGRIRLASFAFVMFHTPSGIILALGQPRTGSGLWCRHVADERGLFGKRSLFFQTKPWIGLPAAVPVPSPMPAELSHEAARRTTDGARVVGANFTRLRPLVLRMLAEGIMAVREDVCEELVRTLAELNKRMILCCPNFFVQGASGTTWARFYQFSHLPDSVLDISRFKV
ncbi:hypothetical protein BC832DRAFT_463986 [Gaertneriomyces semiglobifer]|nr:hypothetical protein BC832DRAFT_463986 [Gaertneriomyces semiglobifer]